MVKKKIILVENKKKQTLLKVMVGISNNNLKDKYLINTVLKRPPIKPIERSKKDIKKLVNVVRNLLVYSKKKYFSPRDNFF